MADPQFTWEWYRLLLDVSKRQGTPLPLRDAEHAIPGTILLRHDVDFDLAAAESLSRIEEEAGVRSSYLFLVSTDFYNVASANGRRFLRELVDKGFDVGLHFDPDVYGDVSLDSAFAAERAFLESITGAPMRSVSLHVPSAHQRYVSFEGLVNAYDPRWFGADRYVSDSSRRWRRDPIEFLTSPHPEVVQVLTHPIHFSENGSAYTPQFDRMTKNWRDRLHAYALLYNATYRAECERDEP
ncbi:MAG: hypothetical protein ACTHQM_05155 [Thermoanaerobaculia bacterium]